MEAERWTHLLGSAPLDAYDRGQQRDMLHSDHEVNHVLHQAARKVATACRDAGTPAPRTTSDRPAPEAKVRKALYALRHAAPTMRTYELLRDAVKVLGHPACPPIRDCACRRET